MSLTKQYCPECKAEDFKNHTHYTVKSGEQRTIYYCPECGSYFPETHNTPMAGLKTPLSQISTVVEVVMVWDLTPPVAPSTSVRTASNGG